MSFYECEIVYVFGFLHVHGEGQDNTVWLYNTTRPTTVVARPFNMIAVVALGGLASPSLGRILACICFSTLYTYMVHHCEPSR